MDPLEAADARAVESDTLSEGILVEFIPGYRKMLPLAQHVAKAEIDHIDLMRRNCLEDIAGSISHALRLWCTHTDSLSGFELWIFSLVVSFDVERTTLVLVPVTPCQDWILASSFSRVAVFSVRILSRCEPSPVTA